MRVFPFQGAVKAGEFMMEFPCVIGGFHVNGPAGNERKRSAWLEYHRRELNMRSDRERATAIENKEQLDKILNVLVLLDSTDGMFVEPKGSK